MNRTLLPLAAALALAAPAHADDAAKEPLAVMQEYFRLWNAHDAKTISARFYHLDPSNPLSTQAGLQAEFDRLKAQGYDKSVLYSMDTCLLSPTSAMTILRFSRIKTDGAPMPPKDRASMYRLRKFPEGWRVVDMLGMDSSVKISCKSAKG